MLLKKLRLRNFKRFDDLTIDLGDEPSKIVALVGPNGCGKSSVFDAFEDVLHQYIGSNGGRPADSYYSKSWYSDTNPVQAYNRGDAVQLTLSDEQQTISRTSFYVRSAYRFTSALSVGSIQALGDPLADERRPGSSFRLDQRLQTNYERMLGQLLTAFWQQGVTGQQVRQQLIGSLNDRLERVLEIRVSELGDVSAGKGQLFFEKGGSKNFPFENLSAGEKEVIDLLVDLVVKTPIFSDTVYAIDEPELHLNTSIQRKLLSELASLIPENCQLWVATHSIGFLRALQQDLAEHSQVFDFSEADYFTGAKTIAPMTRTRSNWKRVFSTALEDLTGLLAPEAIVYCEGKPEPLLGNIEQGLDALVYNQVFEAEFPETLFISSGGGAVPVKNSELALQVLSKAFDSVSLRLLKDRDEKTDHDRLAFLAAAPANRMLVRREIENYLFAFEILSKCSTDNGCTLTKADFDALVPDERTADLKLVAQKLKQLCGFSGSVAAFKMYAAQFIAPTTVTYAELKACVF
jgi:energy-coupling factor transporter ATP-binding protein EcfA2